MGPEVRRVAGLDRHAWNPSDRGWEDQHRQARRLRDTARKIVSGLSTGFDDSAMHLAPRTGKDGVALTDQERRAEVAGMLGEVVKRLSVKSMQRDILGQVRAHHGSWPGWTTPAGTAT